MLAGSLEPLPHGTTPTDDAIGTDGVPNRGRPELLSVCSALNCTQRPVVRLRKTARSAPLSTIGFESIHRVEDLAAGTGFDQIVQMGAELDDASVESHGLRDAGAGIEW